MAAVAFATRRMWLRRWNRVGWLMTGLLKLPFYPFLWVFWFLRAWVRSWSNTASDMFWGGSIVVVLVTFFSSVTAWQMHLARNATTEEIQEARKADTCFDNTIVRRAAAWNRPVTVRDIKVTQDDCAEMWRKIREMEAQKAALAAQLKK